MSLVARSSVVAALLLAACGGSSKKDAPAPAIATLVPADGAVAGWTRSGLLRILPAATAGLGAGSGGVNGDADPFVPRGLVQLAIQRYAKSSQQLELRIWQMRDAAAEADVWSYLTTSEPRYSGANWSVQAIGEAGRISDTGTYWWLVARKGAYTVEATIQPDDAAARTEVIAFLGAVVAGIP